MTPRTGTRGQAWVVAALLLGWLAAMSWARLLTVPDEGRYAGVAWEMLRSGDWLTPTLNGLPFFHKPPLFYWITASALSLAGMNEWAARVASMLGAFAGGFALFLFVRRWSGERAARSTAVALAVQPLFFFGGQFANLDMLVAGCITVTIVLLAHVALSIERQLPHRGALAAAYAFAALGVLAKGLIGVVIPGLVVLAWLSLLRRWRTIGTLIWVPGLLVFLAIAAPWFVAMQLRFADFLHYFFVVQHFQRYAAGGFNNPQPFWFFPAVLLLFSLPWTPWLRRALGKAYFGDTAQGAIRLLMVLWVVLVTLFFSLPVSKLLGYILPAVPALAFLMADTLRAHAAPSARAVRAWWSVAALSGIVCIGAVIYFSFHPLRSSRDLAAALAAQRGANEAVYMLNAYYYDVPFYARLRGAVNVVDDWGSPEVDKRDNWRKELADAAAFAPAAAASILVVPASLPGALCAAPVSWLIGSAALVERYPFLAQGETVARQGDTVLWRIEPARPRVSSALRCPGTPSDGSPGK